MPVYVYHCDACGEEFEANQRITEDPLTVCQCGEEGQVRRLLTAGAGVIFKGSGFYQTDYKGSGSKPKAEESSSSSKSGGSSHSCGSSCGCGS